MQYLSSFFLGLFVTFLTTLLPGLINMTVAKISLKEGKSRAFALGLGASIIVFFQALIATIFARFIDKRTDINHLIQEIGIGIFLLLSIYFFFFAKKKKIQNEEVIISSKRSHFLMGMFLSLINVFPIPFYVILSITLGSYGYFHFDKPFLILFSLGASLGAMSIFYIYANFIKKIESKAEFFMKNVNYLLGSVTLLIAVLGIIKLINE